MKHKIGRGNKSIAEYRKSLKEKPIEQILTHVPLRSGGEPTDNWISVEDDLPDFGENVLVAYMPSSPIMERWSYMVTKRVNAPKGTIYARMMDDNNFRIDGVVTHYQPLPSPPKTK